jgi:hypothetical protein
MEPLEAHLRHQIERSRYFFWHRLRWRAVCEYLPVSRTFQLLDVGAGAGILGEYLTRSRPQAIYRFIEPLDSLERHLESRYGIQANARALASYQGIEFITLLDVLEHQEEDHPYLADLVERMVPGATLLITVPALMSLWSAWDVALGHYRRYDRRRLADCAKDLPVRVLEVSYLFPELVPAALIRRRRLPANSGAMRSVGEAHFPDPPRAINDFLHAVGSVSLALRRVWPIGSSLFAALERR